MTQHSLAKKSSGTLFQSGFPYFSRMTFTNCKDRMCIRIQNICKIQYKIEKKNTTPIHKSKFVQSKTTYI